MFLQVGEQELTETVVATLMSLWKFRKFTESRWLTIGSSCRVMVAGLLTGLDDFVGFIQRECSSHVVITQQWWLGVGVRGVAAMR